MKELEFDLVIIGAGPSGCACAFQLRNENLKIAIIDKSSFPRDKICGDALSADVINQFRRMDIDLEKRFEKFAEKLPSHGIRFYSRDGALIEIPVKSSIDGKASGYISKRVDFDNFWFNQIKEQKNLTVFTNQKVLSVASTKSKSITTTEGFTFNSRLIIGADGAQSIVSRELAKAKLDKESHAASLRQYYTGVEGMHENNFIELHFQKEISPGYFWIFPLPNGHANVGLGMLSSEVSKGNINLKAKLRDIINNHPQIKERFKNATAIEEPKGFGIPIGMKKKSLSGNGYLLLGDAANLVDPFTGEGIANAIRSGRLAAEHIIKAFSAKKFNAKFNLSYDKLVYDKVWTELKLSASMLKITINYPWISAWFMRKAATNPSIKTLLTSMIDDINLKKELLKPSFYFKLIFK